MNRNTFRLITLGCLGFTLALAGGSRSAQAAEPQPRLLIVAPQALHPALGDFLRHKQKQRPTELVTLERVIRSTRGVDDPEKLKRFLYQP